MEISELLQCEKKTFIMQTAMNESSMFEVFSQILKFDTSTSSPWWEVSIALQMSRGLPLCLDKQNAIKKSKYLRYQLFR